MCFLSSRVPVATSHPPPPPPNPFTLALSEYFLDEESEIEDESRRK